MNDPLADAVFDEGLQPERTALAWDRTGLAMIVAGALLVRDWSASTPYLFAAAGGVMMAVGGVVLIAAYTRYGRLHRVLRTGGDVTNPRLVRLVGVSTVAFSLVAIVRTFLP